MLFYLIFLKILSIITTGDSMVILFADRKSKTEKEIIKILKNFGADYISDKAIRKSGGKITLISQYKPIDIQSTKDIVIICDETRRFEKLKLPNKILGIFEDTNKIAAAIFKESKSTCITCGLGIKNTVTLSSIECKKVVVCLQRTVTDFFGNEIEPGDFAIKISADFSPFSIMASFLILLLHGIIPIEF